MLIEEYPKFSRLSLEQRTVLHPHFQSLPDGISEFTFACIYLFREAHDYAISDLGRGSFVISGGGDRPFFMLPFGLPSADVLEDLFSQFKFMKCIPLPLTAPVTQSGYRVWEDRDNFDYLYRRTDLAEMKGRKFHSQKNLINSFVRENQCMARPLVGQRVGDALRVLDAWKDQQDSPGDYAAAREALDLLDPLQLCGYIFYVDGEPVAYTLGEELAQGRSFVIHFEKAILKPRYHGIYQYVNRSFAASLPEKYDTINREQDLGDPGLRRAKEGYKPMGFVKKYRASQQ